MSQNRDIKKWKYVAQMSALPHVGYVWQDLNCIEFGLRAFTLAKGHENFSLICEGLLFQYNVTYLAPQFKLRYYRPFKKTNEKLGAIASMSFWTKTIEGRVHSYLAPEIGMTFHRSLNLTYGYNFKLVDTDPPLISGHRLALRLIVF